MEQLSTGQNVLHLMIKTGKESVGFCSKGVQAVNHVKKAQIGKRVCHSVTCARRQKSEREEAKNTESSHSDGS
jgi:hypothetical protein